MPSFVSSRLVRLVSRLFRSKCAHVFLESAAQVSTYPFRAAISRVSSSQGQTLSRAHFSTSRWPPFAASAHVISSHGHPFSRAHFQHLEVAGLRCARARLFVPRAVVLARPLQHLEVAAIRRVPARALVPRPFLRAQRLQLLELSADRRCRAQAFFKRQTTPRVHVLQRGQVSLLHGIVRLLDRSLRRRHCGAHPSRNRGGASEICGVVQLVRPDNVRDDEMVGKARNRRCLLDAPIPVGHGHFRSRTQGRTGKRSRYLRCAASEDAVQREGAWWLCRSTPRGSRP